MNLYSALLSVNHLVLIFDPISPLLRTRSGFERKQHARNISLNHASGARMMASVLIWTFRLSLP